MEGQRHDIIIFYNFLLHLLNQALNLCLPGDTGALELQYSSFNLALTF